MAVSGWFGPAGWTVGWEENWEFKKLLMNGDLGVTTGEQGTVLRFVKKSKLADEVLLPLTPQLKKMGYCGNVDVNCIIDDHGCPWSLEFTMRPPRVSGFKSSNSSVLERVPKRRNREGIPTGRIMIHPAGREEASLDDGSVVESSGTCFNRPNMVQFKA
jgi:hypothetical protein